MTKNNSKFQTTKIILYAILAVWISVTFLLLGIITAVGPPSEQLGSMMTIYQLVTVVMIQGVIGYLVKSTIENKSKYGNIPYGEVLPSELLSEAINNNIDTLAPELNSAEAEKINPTDEPG